MCLCVGLPLWLMLLEDFPLRVVSDDPDVDEAAQVELFRAECRVDHVDGVVVAGVTMRREREGVWGGEP